MAQIGLNLPGTSKKKFCVRSFPYLQFPFLTQSPQQVKYFGHKYLQNLLNSYTVVEALYTYQTPFDHQIKGGCSISS